MIYNDKDTIIKGFKDGLFPMRYNVDEQDKQDKESEESEESD